MKEAKDTGIRVYLPLLPEEGGDHRVDQTVCVTVNGENTLIQRGTYVEVSPEVYAALYNSHRFERL